MEDRNSPLKTLSNILNLERDKGYTDKSVAGGLDRFLDRWEAELRPVLGALTSYSVLNPEEREAWVAKVIGELGELPQTNGGGAAAKKFARPATPRKRTVGKGRTVRIGLDDPITALYRFPRNLVPKFKVLRVETVGDLLYHVPHRHNDFAKIRKISELEFAEEQSVVAKVLEIRESRQGPARRSTEAVLDDDSGSVKVIWFNNPYLAKSLKPGTSVVVSGKLNVFRGHLVFESPEYEVLPDDEDLVHTGRLVPVYATVDGLAQRTIRRFVKQALDIGISQLAEFLPEDTRHRVGLVGLQTAVSQAHYPDSPESWSTARHRLAFDELLLLQLGVLSRKRSWQSRDLGIALAADLGRLNGFLSGLPFELTAAQSRVLDEVLADMARSTPMARLVQGDVGSGKTVVAAAAMLIAAFDGYQSVLMAPTEVLAEQHFITLSYLLGARSTDEAEVVDFEVEGHSGLITMGLLIGSLRKKAKEDMHRRIAEGEVDLVIGTQALIQDQVEISKLALAVVDEQHRFGVMQRTSLRGKGGRPHLLAMSATPIPRSLSLTLYGDLDISVVDEMPIGRLPIRTRWIEPERRHATYNFVKKEIAAGHQAFVVCPLIDKSEKLQTQAAVEEYERLSEVEFSDLRVGLLHGRMPLREKEDVMEAFRGRDLDVLVSTPVVEVGIDVPNATVMVVDGAERFGLAQLHQLRGRVGRGPDQSYCLLLADSPGSDARKRLEIVQQVTDGFDLAERDLEMRGPGDYLGTRQTGFLDLKVARITDHEILTEARAEALLILKHDPTLSSNGNALLSERVKRANPAIDGHLD